MLVLAKLVGKLFEKMLLSTKILWHNAQNIYISIVTVCFQPETSKYFQSITNLLKIKYFIISCFSNLGHPSIYYLP